MWFIERVLDFIDNRRWHALVNNPKSDAVFDALVARDDAAQAGDDGGISLDVPFEKWDRQHDINR